MAKKIWTGATDGSFNTTTNYSPTGKPVDGDDVFYVKDYLVPVTSGLDQSSGTGLHLGKIQTERGFNVAIGASGNPLIISCDRLVHRAEGQLWYKDGTGTSLTHTHEIIIASPETSSNAAILDGAAMERILIRRGRVQIAGSASAIGRLEIGHESNPLSDVVCDVAAGAGAIGQLILNGGRQLTTRCAVNMAVCNAGTWVHEAGDCGFLVNSGATVVWNPAEADGEIITAYLMSGVTDFLKTSRGKRIRYLLKLPGAQYLRDENLMTVDNGIDGAYVGDVEAA